MRKAKISNNVIRRLPRYLRKLDDLADAGVERISSGEMGRQMGLTPSQIRQDFSCFGEFGQQGYGYNVEMLRREMSVILGISRRYNVILIGVGNLGRALLENFGFERNGFNLLAAFDINSAIVGKELSHVTIRHAETLPEFVRGNKVDIAVLTVPRRAAQSMADAVTDCGIKAIWNFTNVELSVSDPEVLMEDIHFSDSLLTLSYYLSEAEDAARGEETLEEKA